jgi:hypothetical protein
VAEKLDSYDFSQVRPGRQGVHKWSEWLDGSVWKLKRGEDFQSKPTSMRQQIKSAARDRGLEVDVDSPEDGVLVMQARAVEAG